MERSKDFHRIAFAVTEPDNPAEHARWKPAGVTFLNQDGSETVLLDTLPVSGKLVLQVPKKKEDAEGS